ncbi:nucleotidyltransferase family protein [candidate division TA06 bacterium]|uniref:Nucleotidyltransferase family protein n=1 Tax=candidate division TA06 bacterium TaxID=2250710 RepID=A0A933IDA5_UNCT6|nr:nucleotidyltransferase family protein [candidate division TA06 bacterium]
MTKNAIIKAISSHREILDRNRVRSISLFGSYVRNEQRDDSDIDLLVEFEKCDYDNFINLIFDMELLLGKTVTVVTPEGLSPYIAPFVLKEVEPIEGR